MINCNKINNFTSNSDHLKRTEVGKRPQSIRHSFSQGTVCWPFGSRKKMWVSYTRTGHNVLKVCIGRYIDILRLKFQYWIQKSCLSWAVVNTVSHLSTMSRLSSDTAQLGLPWHTLCLVYARSPVTWQEVKLGLKHPQRAIVFHKGKWTDDTHSGFWIPFGCICFPAQNGRQNSIRASTTSVTLGHFLFRVFEWTQFSFIHTRCFFAFFPTFPSHSPSNIPLFISPHLLLLHFLFTSLAPFSPKGKDTWAMFWPPPKLI